MRSRSDREGQLIFFLEMLSNIVLLLCVIAAVMYLFAGRLKTAEPEPTPEILVVEKPYIEYIPVPEPVKVEVEVPVKETVYVEVPVAAAERAERYAAIAVSPEDRENLARLAWREARGEKTLGMRMVVEVVLNRVLSEHFPDSVTGVLCQPGQFAPDYGVPELEEITPGPEQYTAVDLALTETPITEEDVVFFATTPIYGEVFMKVGGHVFCRYE